MKWLSLLESESAPSPTRETERFSIRNSVIWRGLVLIDRCACHRESDIEKFPLISVETLTVCLILAVTVLISINYPQ